MLSFNKNTLVAQDLAIHYAQAVDDQVLIDFMSAKTGLESRATAEHIARGFWAMTSLSIADNEADKEVCGIQDLEFWMYKLFNKVSGYFSKTGYADIWDRVSEDVRAE